MLIPFSRPTSLRLEPVDMAFQWHLFFRLSDCSLQLMRHLQCWFGSKRIHEELTHYQAGQATTILNGLLGRILRFDWRSCVHRGLDRRQRLL